MFFSQTIALGLQAIYYGAILAEYGCGIMNTKDLLVSIIVPVYRVEEYLEQCMNSLISQTYPHLEIILVDDESPDNCPALCDAFAAQYNSVHVIHKKNEGAAFARKSGLDSANGNYVLFVDGDDWLDIDTVSKCVEVALRDEADCVLFGYFREYPEKSIANPLFDQDFSYDRTMSEQKVHRRIVGMSAEELLEPHRIDNLSPFWMRLLRTTAAKKGRFVSDKEVGTSEDTIFNLYALEGCKVSYIHRCFYHYRKTNTLSLTTAYKPDLAEKWDTMYGIFQEYIDNSGKAKEYHPLFLNRVSCAMIGLGLNEVSSSSSLCMKTSRIRAILNKPLYKQAFTHLDISYCSIKWKFFFLLCKAKAAFLLVILLHLIHYLRSRSAA